MKLFIFAAFIAVGLVGARPEMPGFAENEQWLEAIRNIQMAIEHTSASIGTNDYVSRLFQQVDKLQEKYEKATMLLSSFSYNDCSSGSDPAHLRSLTVTPDPIPVPGDITVAAQGVSSENIGGSLSADVKIEVNPFGHIWVPLPCVDNIGSCTYNDFCSILPPPSDPCPDVLKKAGIPCRCPFAAGNYTLPRSDIKLPSIPLPIKTAKLRVTANLKSTGRHLTCVQLIAKVEIEK